jgi:HlyD family secretion protein
VIEFEPLRHTMKGDKNLTRATPVSAAVQGIAVALLVTLGACSKTTDPTVVIETAAVERRNIVLSAQANGTVEPVTIVEVKSKASGTIIRMPVDIGSNVKVGDLLVQIDPRDVQNQYDQSAADLSSATVQRSVALAQRNRSADLFRQKIITQQEMEQATLAFANADAAVIKARTNLSIARVRLEDATVQAPTNGTIIERPVSVGTVITSATSSASGGTTILKMADLSKVRMRSFVNETDIGNVQPGQVATVTVDAYPNRRFVGIVERVDPQAIVQSSVTMFPVLVSLNNSDGALKPGMNGQVVMDIARRDNVLAVPSDAVRNARDAATVATVLGVSPDSLRSMLAAGRRGGTPGTAAAGAGGAGGGSRTAFAAGTSDTTRGGRFRGNASSTPGAAGQSGDSAGRRRFAQGAGGAASSTGSSFGGGQAGAGGAVGAAGGGRGGMQVVFVKKDGKYTPRPVRLGISDFDYTEVLSGVTQGEQVALLGAALLQAQREAQQARMRAGTGGGLQQQTTPAPAGGGGGGGRQGGN